MPNTKQVDVEDLSLDLANYRTVPQPSEAAAVEAMVATSPDRFWALTESLLVDGYLPTDTIIVLRGQGSRGLLTVKEGNRRVAALKLIHGLIAGDGVSMPANIVERIDNLSTQWKRDNKAVPCAVYDAAKAATVERIVALAHGKGEKAGRDQWNAVARARHNRTANASSEPALDLLEKYLQHGKNVTARQRAHWAGDYPLTVLAEAMKRLAPRVGKRSSVELAVAYPTIPDRDAIEGIVHDIGREELGFEKIRKKDNDFGAGYGVAAAPTTGANKKQSSKAASGGGTSGKRASSKGSAPREPRAVAITNPKAIRQLLLDFHPRGKKRGKVETLRLEAVNLNVTKTPLAFCFVIRSMFEISAKAYCADHGSSGLTFTKAAGQDRALVDVLRDITSHLTKNNTDKAMVRALHGAMAELGKTNGLLSVTSMNQLVHNPRFSITPGDIAILFGNVSPLLEAMSS